MVGRFLTALEIFATLEMQADLFKAATLVNCCRHEIADASLLEFPGAFSAPEADRYFQLLQAALPWEQASIRIAGKLIPVPRLQCWVGDEGAAYSYSGLRLKVLPWISPLPEIKARVEQLCQHRFNSVLVNYYRDGSDSVSWHSDNESELGQDPVVASLSLGASRVFELKHKSKKPVGKIAITLHRGSLLLMGKGMQQNWLHQIPKSRDVNDGRINLTFRWVIPATANLAFPRG